MLIDEIVDEVQAIRIAHAAQFDFDLLAIYADLKHSETARIVAGHSYIEPPGMPITPVLVCGFHRGQVVCSG